MYMVFKIQKSTKDSPVVPDIAFSMVDSALEATEQACVNDSHDAPIICP